MAGDGERRVFLGGTEASAALLFRFFSCLFRLLGCDLLGHYNFLLWLLFSWRFWEHE